MKRSSLGLEPIADWDNLAAAFHCAARGKTTRPEVRTFQADLPNQLAALRRDILAGTGPLGDMRSFRLYDPKPRLIHAPCFRERVLHHAIMAHVGPVLDRSLIADSFACRVGKGALAAIQRVQQQGRRFPWYGQIDIASYFATICHARLGMMLARRFKNPALLALLNRIIAAYHTTPGRGLPIGALPSQHFANAYLGPLDRFVADHPATNGCVRYMDDLVWWGLSRQAARQTLTEIGEFVGAKLDLTVKPTARIGQSGHGIRARCGRYDARRDQPPLRRRPRARRRPPGEGQKRLYQRGSYLTHADIAFVGSAFCPGACCCLGGANGAMPRPGAGGKTPTKPGGSTPTPCNPAMPAPWPSPCMPTRRLGGGNNCCVIPLLMVWPMFNLRAGLGRSLALTVWCAAGLGTIPRAMCGPPTAITTTRRIGTTIRASGVPELMGMG